MDIVVPVILIWLLITSFLIIFFKKVSKNHKFEVGDEIVEDCEAWEKPETYKILEVGKKQYKLMELSGYDNPYRKPDDYIHSRTIWSTDSNFNKR